MTARPPAASTTSAIARSPQATTTGPISAATARRQTCTIIGVPAMSASGLPGSRVAASRAGNEDDRVFGCGSGHWCCLQLWLRAATTCPVRPGAGSVIIRLSCRGEFDFCRPDRVGGSSMSSFEWNKIIASVLTAMIVAMVVRDPGESARPPEGTREAGLYRRRAPKPPRARRRPRRPQPDPSRSGRCSPRPIPRRASRSPRSAPHATPSTRAAPTRSARTCGISPRKRSPRCRAISSPPRWQAHKGEKWDPEKLNEWLCKPQDFDQGHQDDLCRHPQGAGPRRCHRLSRETEIGHRAADATLDAYLALASASRRCGGGGDPALFPQAARGRRQARSDAR